MIAFDWHGQVLKWVTVIFFSMLKFVGGPLAGFTFKLSVWEIIILTIIGMMSSVLIVAIGGRWIINAFTSKTDKRKKIFTKKNRTMVKTWSKYGMWGVAALTPILFTPIGGTAIVVSFGEPLKRILLFMFVSAVLWAFAVTFTLYYLGGMLGLVDR